MFGGRESPLPLFAISTLTYPLPPFPLFRSVFTSGAIRNQAPSMPRITVSKIRKTP